MIKIREEKFILLGEPSKIWIYHAAFIEDKSKRFKL